jgi:hypothetical protein
MSISEQQHSIETGFGNKSEASEVMSGIDLSGKSGPGDRWLFWNWF